MLLEELERLYQKLRLNTYRQVFRNVRDREGSLSATEAFSADIIHLLGEPTVSQFAAVIGISQPNATYKVNSLVAKGYVVKEADSTDRREVRLKMGDKFCQYVQQRGLSMERALETLRRNYTEEELTLTAQVVKSLLEEIEKEENANGSV